MNELVSKYSRAIKTSFKAARYYKQNHLLVLAKCFHLRKQYGFSPHEAYELDLLSPFTDKKQIAKYCSTSRFVKYQKRLNPLSYVNMTENKSFFHKICKLSKIETPNLLAVFFKNNIGYDFDNKFIRDKEEWINYFENKVSSDIVIKPSSGSHGHAVYIFNKKYDEYIDFFGKKYTPNDIYNLMNLNEEFDSFIIEEKLVNHHDFSYLSKTKALQTIRFITYIDSKNEIKILFKFLKIANENSIIDNLDFGKTGNLLSEISDEGKLKTGVTMVQGEPGIKKVVNHPNSYNKIEGFQIPLWSETIAFVETVAPKLLPLRFVGWDVAITEDGPKLIEGNFLFDTPNFFEIANELIRLITIDNNFEHLSFDTFFWI